MLKTLKQLKGMLNLGLGFSVEGQGASSWGFDLKNHEITDEFISQNRNELIKYFQEKWKNSFDGDAIWISDFNMDLNSYDKAKKLADLLWVSYKALLPTREIVRKLQEFDNARGQVISESQKARNVNVKSLDSNKSNNDFYSGIAWYETVKNNTKALNDSNPVVDDFEIKRDWKNKNKVLELQQELNSMYGANLVLDGKFWPRTRAALENARGNSNKRAWKDSIVSSQFEWNFAESPLFEDKQYSQVEASRQVEKTWQAMSELQARIETTKALNGNLSGFFYADKEWYHIKRLLTSLFWKDKYSKIEAFKNSEASKLAWNKAKLERAIWYLRNYSSGRNSDDFVEEVHNREILSHVVKALPWLAGIYLFDIPLPFWKEMVPWADINKSVMFNKWIESGMKEEFKDYYKSKKWELLNPLAEQATLKWVLSQTELTSDQQAAILDWDLSRLDAKTRSMLLAYIEHILIPNIEAMATWSFNPFEKWFLWVFKDKKYDTVAGVVKGLKEFVASGWRWIMPSPGDAFNALEEEWDIDVNIVTWQREQVNYMWEISWDNENIQRKFAWLAKLWKEKFNDYNRVFALKDLNNLYSVMWVNPGEASIQSLINILSVSPISWEALNSWQAQYPGTYRFIKALWSDKAMLEYRISSVPRINWLRKINVWNSKHWEDLSKYSNEEALARAESTTPEKWGKISTLWYAYKSFVEKWRITGVSYEEFRNAFAGKQTVPVNELQGKQEVLNTWRKEWQFVTINPEKLKTKDVFKLAPIQKSYTIFENGEEVTITTNYQLYLKTDCSNPLIVPGTVNITKRGVPVQDKELTSLIQVSRRLPIVIPWSLFKKPPKTPGKTPPPPPPTPPTPTPPLITPPPYIPPNTSTPGLNTIPWNKETLLPKPGANGVIPRPWNFSPSAPDLIDRGTVVNPGQNIWNNLGWL